MSGGGFQHDIAGGQGALIIAALKSPNFVHGSAGWSVNKDGSAEFNNGTFRGTLTAGKFVGADFIINSSGAFFYSGTPGPGNLLFSFTQASTTDSFGNYVVGGGLAVYQVSGSSAATTTAVVYTTVGPELFKGGSVPSAVNFGTGVLNINHPVEIQFQIGAAVNLILNSSLMQSGFPIVATVPGGTAAETWHPMTLLNSWAAAARITPKYRLVASPPNTTEIIGSLTAPAGIVAGQIIWNLPAGYTVSGLQSVVARNVTTNVAVMLSVVTTATQTLQYQSGAVAGDIIDFHAYLSQDA